MNYHSNGGFLEVRSQRVRRIAACRAFTLIELLVTIGMLAVLSTLLLPALCKAKSQSRTTACAANFRQWAVSANLYAKDNLEWLPSFNPAGGGMYIFDVGTNMCNALGPYGLDVPTWFCPARPTEWESANKTSVTWFNHVIRNINDLREYFSHSFPNELILNHNYWVPRAQGTQTFPTDYSPLNSTVWPSWLKSGNPESAIYGWPRKLHDAAAARVAFVSDKCGSGISSGLAPPPSGVASSELSDISPNTAHFVNGKLIGVNAAYADGRVEARGPSKIRCAYSTPTGSTYWFY